MHLFRVSIVLNVLAAFGLLAAACAPSASSGQPATSSLSTSVVPTSTPAPRSVDTPQPAATPTTQPSRAIPSPIAASTGPKRGGVLVRWNPIDPVSSDTHQESSTLSMWPFVPMHSLLVTADPGDDAKLVGDLAESWQVKDGVLYTFKLRSNATWHDGKPVTAEDVKFTLQRIMNPPKGIISPRQSLFLDIVDKVEAPDPQTVTVHLKFPSASFIALLGTESTPIFPKHVIEARGGHMKSDPVGSGPFMLKSWARGARIELVRNPNFYLPGRPYLDGVTFLVIAEPATQVAALRTGRVDVSAPGSTGISAANAETLSKEVPGIVLGSNQALSLVGPAINVTQAPFNDVRVRKALFVAFNQQEIIDLANPKGGLVAGVLPPSSSWSLSKDELAKVPGIKEVTAQDIAEAKKLLADAGVSSLSFTMPVRASQPPQVRAGEVMRQQMNSIGVKVTLQSIDDAVLFEMVNKRNFKVSQVVFNHAIGDPDNFLVHYKTGDPSNYFGYSSKETDGLIDKQRTSMDAAERQKIVFDIQRKLLDEYLFRPFYISVFRQGWWNYVKGFRLPSVCCQTYDDFRDVWLDK